MHKRHTNMVQVLFKKREGWYGWRCCSCVCVLWSFIETGGGQITCRSMAFGSVHFRRLWLRCVSTLKLLLVYACFVSWISSSSSWRRRKQAWPERPLCLINRRKITNTCYKIQLWFPMPWRSRSHGSVRVVRATNKVNGKCWTLTPQPTQNPLSDRHQIWHTWLRRGYLPPRKNWPQSVKGFLLPV